MPKKPPQPEPEMLIARIEGFEQTYYISEYREHTMPVQDEAFINITGRIERISPRHKQHLYREIEINLACSRGFEREGRTVTSDRPFLLPVRLRKEQCAFMAYLPADAFWAIPRMIETSRISHIEARFEPVRYGSGTLLSLHLIPESKLDGLYAISPAS